MPEEVLNSYKKLETPTSETAAATPDEEVRQQAKGNTDMDALKKLMDMGNATRTMWGT